MTRPIAVEVVSDSSHVVESFEERWLTQLREQERGRGGRDVRERDGEGREKLSIGTPIVDGKSDVEVTILFCRQVSLQERPGLDFITCSRVRSGGQRQLI